MTDLDIETVKYTQLYTISGEDSGHNQSQLLGRYSSNANHS